MRHSESYSEPPPAGPAGENLAQGSVDVATVVRAWYAERNCCGGFPGCTRPKCTTGHFTALVWSGVSHIGCATNATNLIALCRYWSGPTLSGRTANMQGAYRQNVLAPSRSLAECLSGAAL
jgi:hypothetical protein